MQRWEERGQLILPTNPKSGSCNVSYISEPLRIIVFGVIRLKNQAQSAHKDDNSTSDTSECFTMLSLALTDFVKN